MENDVLIFSEENLLEQICSAELKLGFYKVKFYTKEGVLSDKKTNTISDFFLYPSGGTLRDSNFNIVFYSSKFDAYRGFIHPEKK